MLFYLLLAFVIFIAVFLIYVATRNPYFLYERSGIIKATPEKIFPYLSDFQKGYKWSPYEKKDPHMQKIFRGPDGQVGSVMEFEGNKDTGSGQLEFLKIIPYELVEIQLTMIKPIPAVNKVQYKLTPEPEGTKLTWTMSGKGGFLGKMMTVLIDCEKLIADQFTEGINNLKNVVENED